MTTLSTRIELNTDTSADHAFLLITNLDPSETQISMLRKLVALFWDQLSENNRNIWRAFQSFNKVAI
jgi:hypothetical protein